MFSTDNKEIKVNKALVDKFPFLLPRNRWTDKVPEDYDYSYTELDAIPDGWRSSFGIKLCEDLKQALEKQEGLIEQYRILQIKEKYGCLRWYDNFSTKELGYIVSKYEELSTRTCINCGKPAKKISTGWISPYCDSCASEQINERFIPIEEYYDS